MYHRSEPIIARQVAGEDLLIPIRGELADMSRVYLLNAVGRFLWDRLDGETAVDGLVGAVVTEFATTPEAARRDVEAFLADLAAQRLVTTTAAEPHA